MPREKRPTVSLTEDVREKLGPHPSEKIGNILDENLRLKQENAKLKEDDQLKNQASVTKPPMENFDSEAIKKTCPYPMPDSKLGRYMCSKAKSDDLITLPKDRILTNEVCKLCQAETQKAPIAEAENTPELEMPKAPQKLEKENEEVTLPNCHSVSSIDDKTVYCDSKFRKGNRKLPINACWACWERKQWSKEQTKKAQELPTTTNHEELEEEETEFPTPTKKPQKLSDPRETIRICEDPFQYRNFNPVMQQEEFRDGNGIRCHLCKMQDPQKRKTCDEIVREIKTSPLARKSFIDASIAKRDKLFGGIEFQTSDSMPLEEIENEFGLEHITVFVQRKHEEAQKRFLAMASTFSVTTHQNIEVSP